MIEQQKVWEKAHRKLKREVRRAHKDVDKRTGKLEKEWIAAGGDAETAQWALDEANRIERKVFRKRRKKLRKLARRESIAFDHYTESEQEQAESFAVIALED